MDVLTFTKGMQARYRGEVVRVMRVRRTKAQIVRLAGLRWVPLAALEAV